MTLIYHTHTFTYSPWRVPHISLSLSSLGHIHWRIQVNCTQSLTTVTIHYPQECKSSRTRSCCHRKCWKLNPNEHILDEHKLSSPTQSQSWHSGWEKVLRVGAHSMWVSPSTLTTTTDGDEWPPPLYFSLFVRVSSLQSNYQGGFLVIQGTFEFSETLRYNRFNLI